MDKIIAYCAKSESLGAIYNAVRTGMNHFDSAVMSKGVLNTHCQTILCCKMYSHVSSNLSALSLTMLFVTYVCQKLIWRRMDHMCGAGK